MKLLRIFSLIFFSCFIVSCSDDNSETKINEKTSDYELNEKERIDESYNELDKSGYHTDPNYLYNHRSGTSGSYEYNYNITGYDEYGNHVQGSIDISGKYGSGYIEDEYGNEKDIDVEWIDYGVLEGTDEEGVYYNLEVE